MKRKHLFFCISIFLLGCKSEHEISFMPLSMKDTVFLEGKTISDTLVLGATEDMDFYKDYLILIAYSEGKYMHVFDRNTGTYLQSFLPKGRGPHEVVSMNSIDIDRTTGKILFYDDMGWQLCECEFDSMMLRPSDYKISKHSSRLYASNGYTYQTQDGSYITGNTIPKGQDGVIKRLAKVKDDKTVSVYNEFPSVGQAFQESMFLAYMNTGMLTVSPDRTKMACGASWGAILEIFDIRDSIRLTTTRYILPPIGERVRNELHPIEGQTIFGFGDLYATEQYIYTIYRGIVYGSSHKVSRIAVFDWKGNCVKLYNTEYRLYNLCVDEEVHKIYAVGVDKSLETVVVEFDME